ncbi:hypothetical protein B0H14DRAFT_2536833 [Mycena olivaceomarginata]|nr:hypothetical protein B0H14DRAFT_2536833 [Mycena olivaceomarginata]
MNNSAAVYDVLCNEEAWHWDTYDGHKLIFHRDGTGEITSWAELNMWIFAIFEWKVTIQLPSNTTRPSRQPAPSAPLSPTSFPALDKSRPNYAPRSSSRSRNGGPLWNGKVFDPQRHINEDALLDAAFEPRVLNIAVERGRFKAPWDGPWSRLSFDVSPYPAKEAWRPRQHAMVDSMGQPKMTQFCAQELAPEDGGCVVMYYRISQFLLNEIRGFTCSPRL